MMRAFVFACALASLVCAPRVVLAQDDFGDEEEEPPAPTPPRLGAAARASSAHRLGNPRVRPEPSTPSIPFNGPRVELGWRTFRLDDQAGAGHTNAFVFGGYVPTHALRLGASAELAGRDYQLGGDDFVFDIRVVAGYQYVEGRLGPLVPYAVAVGTGGIILGKRFHTSFDNGLVGMGLEVGFDLRLVRQAFIGLGFGYDRLRSHALMYDVFSFRLTIGLGSAPPSE